MVSELLKDYSAVYEILQELSSQLTRVEEEAIHPFAPK